MSVNDTIWDFKPAKPDRPGHMTADFLADTAREHVYMAHNWQISSVTRSMHATRDLGFGNANYLQSIVQRPDSPAYAWQDDAGIMPVWLARAISETLDDPDLRVMYEGSSEGWKTTADTDEAEHAKHLMLYRRAMPDHLTSTEPVNWVPLPVGALAEAYGAPGKENVPGAGEWLADALDRAGLYIRRGCTFHCTDGTIRVEYDVQEGRWFLTQQIGGNVRTVTHDPTVRNVKTGKYGMLDADTRSLSEPTTFNAATGCTVAEAFALQDEASAILREWTAYPDPDGSIVQDHGSWVNLALSFAAPFLRSHPENAYVYQGPGGTGKSSLAKDLLRNLGKQASTFPLDTLSQPTALSVENSMLKLQTHLLALSDDYDPRFGRFQKIIAPLKTLLTGLLPSAARRQGRDSVDGDPQAVHLITSNYNLPISGEAAEQRRFRFVTITNMDALDKYREFRRRHDFWPLMLASALAWVAFNGEHGTARAYVGADALTDVEIMAVQHVIVDGYVQPVPGERVDWNKLGLKRSTTRKGMQDGRPHTVYKAPSKTDPLWETWLATRGTVLAMDSDEKPAPIPDGADMPEVADEDAWMSLLRAGGADGVLFPAYPEDTPDTTRPDRMHTAKSPNGTLLHRATGEWSWQKAAVAHAERLRERFDKTWPCWGMTLDPEHLWLDLDCHTEGESGWDRLQQEVGPYGSADFPRTFMVRTPSGGVHVAYRIPDGVKVKNRANTNAQVDVRVGGKGYVLAGGTRTKAGEYRPVDMPEDGRIPDMSDALVRWLAAHDALEPDSAGAKTADSKEPFQLTPVADDTPIRPVSPVIANAPERGRQSSAGRMGSDGSSLPEVIIGPAPMGMPHDPFADMDASDPFSTTTRQLRINPPVMTKGATHDQWRDWCYGIAHRAVTERWSPEQIEAVFRTGMTRVPDTHDRTDTLQCIKDACEKAGCPLPRLD